MMSLTETISAAADGKFVSAADRRQTNALQPAGVYVSYSTNSVKDAAATVSQKTRRFNLL